MSEIPMSSETKTTIRRDRQRNLVQFHISYPHKYGVLTAISKETFKEGNIKAPTISALVRASLMTMANLKLKIDQANEEIKQADHKRIELQAMAGPSKIPYMNLQNIPWTIANVPTYQEFVTQQKRVVI